jgi:hypothetical protein
MDLLFAATRIKAGNYGSKFFRIGRQFRFFQNKIPHYGATFLEFSHQTIGPFFVKVTLDKTSA